MARFEHLPIYKKAMEMNIYLQNTVRQFSRYNKYTIGAELRDLARRILLLIIRANSAKDKEKPLLELVETCDMLKVMLMFAREAKAFLLQAASGNLGRYCHHTLVISAMQIHTDLLSHFLKKMAGSRNFLSFQAADWCPGIATGAPSGASGHRSTSSGSGLAEL